MCYSPTLIKNPNRGRKDKLAYVVDTVSHYIPVPCGHCGECRRLRANGVLQRAQLESLAGYPFMVSLSYNPESLAHYDCSNGYSIPYAPVEDLQNMFKRLRKSNALTRRFRYYAITELGSKKGRPHAHILLYLERLPEDNDFTPLNLERTAWKAILDEWRRNYGSSRSPIYRPLLTYIRKYRYGKIHSTYDLHLVLPSVTGTTDDVSLYVTKYLCKDSEWRDKVKRGLFTHCPPEEALEVWSKIRPRAISSLNFGFGVYDDLNPRKVSHEDRLSILMATENADLVRKSIELSSQFEKSAKFYDIETGKALPLARYWYKFGDIYTLEKHKIFLSRQDRVDGMSISDRDMTSKLISEAKFVKNSADSLTSNYDTLYAES